MTRETVSDIVNRLFAGETMRLWLRQSDFFRSRFGELNKNRLLLLCGGHSGCTARQTLLLNVLPSLREKSVPLMLEDAFRSHYGS